MLDGIYADKKRPSGRFFIAIMAGEFGLIVWVAPRSHDSFFVPKWVLEYFLK